MSGIINEVKSKSGLVGQIRVKKNIYNSGTTNLFLEPGISHLSLHMCGAGSGSQGAWSGGTSGFTGGQVLREIDASSFTAAERDGTTAISVVVGSPGVTNGAHNGNDNGANVSNFGNYATVNGCQADNSTVSTATANVGSGRLIVGSGGVGAGNGHPWPTGGGILGGAPYGPGAGGSTPGGGGGGNGQSGFIEVIQYTEK